MYPVSFPCGLLHDIFGKYDIMNNNTFYQFASEAV